MQVEQPIFLCGPTASGKSRLALELAEALSGEIVNADAFQLYREAPILTAAPPNSEKELLPHHLYGVLSQTETCDAMRYRQMALPVIKDILSRGRTPIVAGGSGLYLKFLTHGPSPIPTSNPKLRAELNSRSTEDLIRQLQEEDPKEASRTDLANRRYLIRALEICLLAERPCSELRDRWESKARKIDQTLIGLFIQRERSDIHDRIKQRTIAMLESGAIDEVRSLGHAPGALDKAIGVRQIRLLLTGEIDRAACLDQIETATRQYAKRQETWFRREKWLQIIQWLPSGPPPTDQALRMLTGDRPS